MNTCCTVIDHSPVSRALAYCRFNQLQQADVTGVEPSVRADITADSVLRDDIPEEFESR